MQTYALFMLPSWPSLDLQNLASRGWKVRSCGKAMDFGNLTVCLTVMIFLAGDYPASNRALTTTNC